MSDRAIMSPSPSCSLRRSSASQESLSCGPPGPSHGSFTAPSLDAVLCPSERNPITSSSTATSAVAASAAGAAGASAAFGSAWVGGFCAALAGSGAAGRAAEARAMARAKAITRTSGGYLGGGGGAGVELPALLGGAHGQLDHAAGVLDLLGRVLLLDRLLRLDDRADAGRDRRQDDAAHLRCAGERERERRGIDGDDDLADRRIGEARQVLEQEHRRSRRACELRIARREAVEHLGAQRCGGLREELGEPRGASEGDAAPDPLQHLRGDDLHLADLIAREHLRSRESDSELDPALRRQELLEELRRLDVEPDEIDDRERGVRVHLRDDLDELARRRVREDLERSHLLAPAGPGGLDG